jgi:hypothetical protein
LARPITEQPFAAVAAVVAAGLALVASLTLTSKDSAVNPAPPSAVGANTKTTGGQMQTAPAPTDDQAQARSVAQTFLQGYLPWLYQQQGSNVLEIHGASPGLMHQLQTERTRPAPAQSDLHPHVRNLSVTQQTPDTALAVAYIDDESGARDMLRITVVRQGADWVVTSLNDD